MTDNTAVKDYSNREARIRLTPKCNYKCFFCHEEGGCKAPVAEWESTRELLLALKRQNRREITFTGGEPLLNKRVLLKCLAEIASWDVQPEVTVITNGVYLDEVVIAALERCHSAKVHVSIHNPRDIGYQLVTGQRRRTAAELKPILKRLSAGSVRLKLNVALTEDYVRDDSVLKAMLVYAREVGAAAVKFVELLETKDASRWPLKGAKVSDFNGRLIRLGLIGEHRTLRTAYWRTTDGITLEVTRCACALGCEHCDATRGDSFTGGTHYHPCFLDGFTVPMTGRTLDRVLAIGDEYIRRRIAATRVGRHAA